jgi:predicted Zn-dependent protease with MMP-like domain
MANVQSGFDEALRAMDGGRPAEALKLVDDSLRTEPDHIDSLLLRSEALVLLDRWEDAEEALEESARRHPKNPAVLLAMSDLIVDCHPDDPAALHEAVTLTERAEGLVPHGDRGGDLVGELRLVRGRALSAMGESTEAVRVFESALEVLGEDPEAQVELAMALFEALQFERAHELLLDLVEEAPDDARIHHYLGLLDERAGRGSEAEVHFARARDLDPDEFPVPVTLTEEEFNTAVEAAVEGLPERVRTYIAEVPVLVEDVPTTTDLEGDPPLSPLSLGMFRGLPAASRSHFDPWSQLPSSIVLFQKNLERYVRSREELIEEIETTVLHEVGHYLGWDEEELYERGLE